jgi:hypothetical protein
LIRAIAIYLCKKNGIQAFAIECTWFEASDGLNLGVRPALIYCYQYATALHVIASTQERYCDTKKTLVILGILEATLYHWNISVINNTVKCTKLCRLAGDHKILGLYLRGIVQVGRANDVARFPARPYFKT